MLSIGIGCRRNCPAAAIVTLVRQARMTAAGDAQGPARLATLADKGEEPGLREAARQLGLNLVLLSFDELQAVMDGVITRSAAAQARFGLASVAEAAALAAAGPGARLLVPRIQAGGATCAIAVWPELVP